jgi:dipeptidyl aminopeptidase/acylaminoacyl peptidase
MTTANPAGIVITSVAADDPTVLLEADALWPLQPDENFPLSFYMEAAAVPADADRLLLLAVAYDPEDVSPSGPGLTADRPGLTAGNVRTQLWRLERSSAELSLLLQADSLSAPQFSPDGRWLWLGGYLLEMQDDAEAVPEIEASLHLFDLQNGWQHSQIDTFASTISSFQSGRAAAWSADGQWLFIAGGDRLQIVAPADNQHLTLPLPAAGCSQVVWDGESGS